MDESQNEGAVPIAKKPQRDWWQKGRALDLWSIPHFLFGVLTSFLPQLLGISFLTALSITIILAMLWEVYEKFADIKETVLNSLFDILLPIVAFVLSSVVVISNSFHHDDLLVIAVAIFLVYLFTLTSGWLAYRRRNREFIH
jgi:hypothetical protein